MVGAVTKPALASGACRQPHTLRERLGRAAGTSGLVYDVRTGLGDTWSHRDPLRIE